jgi:hypothetical protein
MRPDAKLSAVGVLTPQSQPQWVTPECEVAPPFLLTYLAYPVLMPIGNVTVPSIFGAVGREVEQSIEPDAIASTASVATASDGGDNIPSRSRVVVQPLPVVERHPR